MRRRDRVERVGVLGELLRRDRGRPCPARGALRARDRAAAEHALQAAQLGVPLERFEALDDHLRREMRQPIELFDRHAQRLPQLGRLGARAVCSTMLASDRLRQSCGDASSGPILEQRRPGDAQISADLDRIHLAARQPFDARRHADRRR